MTVTVTIEPASTPEVGIAEAVTIKIQIAAGNNPSSNPTLLSVTHPEVLTAFRNPGKGWLPYAFNPLTPAAIDSTPYASAVYSNYIRWSDLEPTEGAYNWALIDTCINTWAPKKTKIGIALALSDLAVGWTDPIPAWVKSQITGGYFTYPDVWEPTWNHPVFLTKLGALITAIGAHYDATPNWQKYVASFDINTYGTYGEWNSNFAFPIEQVSISTFVDSAATNGPHRFSFDDLTINAGFTDTFTRTGAGGWGEPDAGSAYFTYPPAEFDTTGTEGRVLTAAGASALAMLSSFNEHEVDLKVRFRTDKVMTGGLGLVDIDVRQNGSRTQSYIGRAYLLTSGGIQLAAFRKVASVATGIGTPVTLSGRTHMAGSWYWLRVQATGSSPTTVRMKLWADGLSEPGSWDFTTTDNQTELQTAPTGTKIATLTTLVDQWVNAFNGTVKPELIMNIVGSSANGPTTLQRQDVAAIVHAVDSGASMVRRMIGLGDPFLKPDEAKFIADNINTRRFDGEWGSFDGNISWFDYSGDSAPLKRPYQAIDQALAMRASFLGWHKTTDYLVCSAIPDEITTVDIPEKSLCVSPSTAITTNPLDRYYPGTTETLREYFQRRSGYRFVVTRSTYPVAVEVGASFALRQIWDQRAVAKLYAPHQIRASLKSGSVRIVLDIDPDSLDAHTWPAGASTGHAVDSTFTVPASTPRGQYVLQFAVVDRYGLPAMNLAIGGKDTDGLADPVNDYGYYNIGPITIR